MQNPMKAIKAMCQPAMNVPPVAPPIQPVSTAPPQAATPPIERPAEPSGPASVEVVSLFKAIQSDADEALKRVQKQSTRNVIGILVECAETYVANHAQERWRGWDVMELLRGNRKLLRRIAGMDKVTA